MAKFSILRMTVTPVIDFHHTSFRSIYGIDPPSYVLFIPKGIKYTASLGFPYGIAITNALSMLTSVFISPFHR